VRAVNLLPTDLRGASKATAERGAGPEASGGAGAFVVLGVLAACVAGTAGYVLTENTIKQNRADLAQVTARQQTLQAQATKLKPYADFDTNAKARVQTVRDIAGSRFDWEQALRDLSRAIPSDVTLKSLSGDVSAGSGAGGGALRGAVAAPAITLTGCTTGQTQVARLMARLHDVDGVTRVSLSKSDNEKVDSTAGTSGGGQSEAQVRNSAPCGVGKHPSFEVVAFFENSTAAATDSSTSASPAASPTPTATPTATPAGSAASTTTTEGAAK
jgi:Tfp pilus assembly protein PilN